MLYDNLSVNEAGHLVFAGYDTTDLAARYGTALMLLDESAIRNRCRTYLNAMAAHLPAGSMPLYASKALSFKRMYEIMKEEGMGIDVVSSGELNTALRAGFPLEKAFFHGNGKTDFDISFAMEHGMGYFVCDNADELNAIEAEAARRGRQRRAPRGQQPRDRDDVAAELPRRRRRPPSTRPPGREARWAGDARSPPRTARPPPGRPWGCPPRDRRMTVRRSAGRFPGAR